MSALNYTELMAEARRQTPETLPQFLNSLTQAALAEAEAASMMLRSGLDEARSKNLKLEFCLSAILALAEKNKDADLRSCCAMIRVALGLAPLKGCKPALVVDNDRSAS